MIDWKKHERTIQILKNKYVITAILFVVWVAFFDKNDLISRYRDNQTLSKLEEEKDYYIEQIEKNKTDMHDLMSDPENLEKFARENYLMKKDDEEIFIIIREDGSKKVKE